MKKWIPLITIVMVLMFVASSFREENNAGIISPAALGKKLFSEKILSADSTVSCASCHKPAYAFADTAAFSGQVLPKCRE